MIATDRDHRLLVVKDHLRDAGADHADAVLARADPLDDRDIGVADLALDIAAKLLAIFARSGEQLDDRHAADPGGGPEEDLGGTVLADNLRLDAGRADAESAGQVKAEPETVEKGPGAEHALMAEQTNGIGQGIRGIGNDER